MTLVLLLKLVVYIGVHSLAARLYGWQKLVSLLRDARYLRHRLLSIILIVVTNMTKYNRVPILNGFLATVKTLIKAPVHALGELRDTA